jgi:hypothetical protein
MSAGPLSSVRLTPSYPRCRPGSGAGDRAAETIVTGEFRPDLQQGALPLDNISGRRRPRACNQTLPWLSTKQP